MDISFYIELIGYLGSALVVVSMLMTSVLKLRVINTVGSVIFTCYALIIHSYPTAAMNAALIIINIYNMMKLRKNDENFSLFSSAVKNPGETHFLEYYLSDIKKYFPEFNLSDVKDADCLVACKGVKPCGMMIYSKKGGSEVEVLLDYTSPKYRDLSIGKYIHAQFPVLGFKKLVSKPQSAEHNAYLEKMGYELCDGTYVKQLSAGN